MIEDCSESYADARIKFLDLASAKDAFVHSVTHPGLGLDGEELAMDFAVFGDRSAKKTLLLVSGTHGQEGYIGSAIQLAYLRNLHIPDGVNVVALHALNPWGFSHLSRSDELNIDVNRNFLDFSSPLPSKQIYVDAHPLICPEDWDGRAPALEIGGSLVAKFGHQAALDALTGGQYDVATGLNFGGRAPSWTNRTVSEHLPPLLQSAEKVAFVEWHTGLGGFGDMVHICFADPKSEAYDRVWGWFGDEAKASFAVSMQADGATAAYSGPFSVWLLNSATQAEVAGVIIEAGTFSPDAVWEALRMDRWLRFGHGHSSTPREEIGKDMLNRLYPTSPEWREKAVRKGCEEQQRALEGLMNW